MITTLEMSIVQIILLSILSATFIVQAIYYLAIYIKPLLRVKAEKNKQVHVEWETPGVSVIIYANNDSEELEKNLPGVLSQDYPNFEVIVVNDGSSEESEELLSSMEKQYPNLYHTFLQEGARNLSRRKLALTLGIKAAKNDILLFSNANCHPVSDKWIRNMARNFAVSTDVVIGYSRLENKKGENFINFDMLQSALRLFGYTLAFSPFSGQGTNLAYRKSVFFEHKGFARHIQLQPGEDDLFVSEIANKINTKVELSANSHIVIDYDNNASGWSYTKHTFAFTSSFYRLAPRLTFGADSLTRYLLIISSIAGIFLWSFDPIFAYICAGVFLLYYILAGIFWYFSGKLLNTKRFCFIVPIFFLVSPIVNLYFRIYNGIKGKRNYTWHYTNQIS